MPVRKDYYRLLNVAPDADSAALKQAYRRLAAVWHPDRNPDSSVAEDRFKAISEAYAVLGDPAKRRAYDLLGPDNFAVEFSGREIFQGFEANDLFKEFGLPSVAESLFHVLDEGPETRPNPESWRRFFADFGSKPGPQGRRGKAPDVSLTLSVSLREAVFGAVKTAAFNAGASVAKTQVAVPPGSLHGQRLSAPGQVPPLKPGDRPGDLVVTLNVLPEKNFQRQGRHLLTSVSVTRAELQSGCRPEVPTLDGRRLRLTVPPGTAPGARLRAPGHGVPSPQADRGDLLITVLQAL
ncbi:MAG: DnaJ domain-containing protein [Deltaproteobacteria bacterium]|nr:DnaJ domain-containing protein [Deltaproteobacteria bacterium]